MVLDIGGSSTGLCVFEDGNLLSASVLPIGGSHITNDIAIAFQLSIEVAEKLKLKYGMACANGGGRKEVLETKRPDRFSGMAAGFIWAAIVLLAENNPCTSTIS